MTVSPPVSGNYPTGRVRTQPRAIPACSKVRRQAQSVNPPASTRRLGVTVHGRARAVFSAKPMGPPCGNPLIPTFPDRSPAKPHRRGLADTSGSLPRASCAPIAVQGIGVVYGKVSQGVALGWANIGPLARADWRARCTMPEDLAAHIGVLDLPLHLQERIVYGYHTATGRIYLCLPY